MSSKSIDNMVVEMEFDNAKFESGVSTSLSTLDKLKQSLKFDGASKGFENITKASNNVRFSGLSSSIEQVSVKFSALESMAFTVFQNITNSAISTGKQIYNNTLGQIKSGGKSRASNIADAKFQLEGLGVVWKEVSEDINYGVQDTAYGFDSAAKAAAQLSASGIKTGESMKTALRGISGVAAMTNSTYEDISSIYTTVAGNGKLMTDQLNQLSSRGINAAATLGKQLGYTEAEIRSMTTKGEISFQEFADAMDSAFGDHAKDANNTLIGVTSNIKAALSKIGEIFYDPLYEENGPFVKMLQNVKDRLNEIKNALTPLGDVVTDLISRVSDVGNDIIDSFNIKSLKEGIKEVFATDYINADEWATVCEEATSSISGFKDKLIETADAEGLAVSDMIAAGQSFEDTLSSGWLTTDVFKDALNGYSTSVDKTTTSFEELESVADRVINGEFKNAPERYQLLEEAGYDYQKVQDIVNNKLLGWAISWDTATEAELKAAGVTDDEIESINNLKAACEETGTPLGDLFDNLEKPTGKDLLVDGVSQTLYAIKDTLTAIGDGFTTVFEPLTSSDVYAGLESFNEWAHNLRITATEADEISNTFAGFAAVVDLAYQAVYALYRIVSESLSEAFDGFGGDILEATSSFGEFLVGLDESVKAGDDFYNAMQPLKVVITAVASVIRKVAEAAIWAADKLSGLFSIAYGTVSGIVDGATILFSGFFDDIDSRSSITTKSLTGKTNSIVGKITSGFKSIKSIFSGTTDSATETDSAFSGLSKHADTFKETIIEMFNKINNSTGFQKLKGSFDSLKEGIVRAANKVDEVLGNMWDTISETFSISAGTITDFLTDIPDKIVDFFSRGASAIAEFNTAVGNGTVFDSIKDFFTEISSGDGTTAGNVIEHVCNALSDLFSSDAAKQLSSGASSAWASILKGIAVNVDSIIKSFADGDWDTLISKFNDILAIILKIKTVKVASEYIKSLTDINASVQYTIKSVGTALNTMSDILTSFGKSLKRIATGVMIKDIAIAILLLASSLVALSLIDPDKLDNAIVVLGKVAAGLTVIYGLMTLMSKFSSAKDVASTGIAMLSMSTSMIVLAGAVYLFSKMDAGDLAKGITCVSLLILMFSTAAKNIGKVSVGAGTFTGMALAILILVPAVKLFANMPVDDIKKGGLCVVALMTSLSLAARLAGGGGSGSTMLSLSVAIFALGYSMSFFAELSWAQIAKGGAIIEGVMFSIAAAVRLMGPAENTSAKYMNAIIISLTVCMAALTLLDTQRLLVSATCISGTMLALAVALKFAAGFKDADSKKIIAGIIIFIAAATSALVILSELKVDSKELVARAVALGVVMVSLGTSMKLVSGAFQDVNVKEASKGCLMAIEFVAAASLALVAINYALGNSNPKSLIAKALALGTTMISLATSVTIASVGIRQIAAANLTVKEAAASAIVIAAVALTASTALVELNKLSESDATDLIGKSVALGIAMVTLGVAVSTASTGIIAMKYANVSLKDAAVVTLAIAAVSAVAVSALICLDKFSVSDGQELISKSTALSVALLGISTAMTLVMTPISILAALGVTAPALCQAALGYIAAMAIVMVGMASEFALVGVAVEKISGLETAITDGIAVAITISEALGEMIGKFVGGIFSGVAEGLSELEQTTGFFGELNNLFDVVSEVDDETVGKAATCASIIAIITATDLIAGISNLLGINMGSDTLKNNLKAFGEGVAAFDEAIAGKDLDTEKSKQAANIAKTLAEAMGDIPMDTSGSLWGMLFGETQGLDEFGSQLSSFGGAIVDFATSVSTFTDADKDNVQRAADAASFLKTLAANLPSDKDETLAGWFTGDTTSLDEFGSQLSSFGSAMVDFATSVSTFTDADKDNVQRAADAASFLKTLAANLPSDKDETLAGWFTGDTTSLDEFGSQLSSFGSAMVDLGQTYTKNPKAWEALTKIQERIIVLNNIIDLINEKKDLWYSDETTDFTSFLIDLSSVAGEFAGKDNETGLKNLNSMISSIRSLTMSLSDYAAIDPTDIENVTNSLSQLGDDAFTAFITGLSGDQDSVTAAIGTLAGYASTAVISNSISMQDAGNAIATAFSTAIRGSSTKPTLAGKTLVSYVKMGATNDVSIALLKSAGEKAVEAFKNGLLDIIGLALIKASGKTLATKAKDGAEQLSLRSAGENAASGFINGILSKLNNAAAAGNALGSRTKASLKRALDIHSPSRELYKIGVFAVQGFTNAFASMDDYVGKVVNDMGDTVLDTLSGSIQNIDNVLSDDYLQPTITPVLDLTNVNTGIAQLGSMMTSESVSLSGKFGSVYSQSTALSNATSQLAELNASGNRDVVDSITSLTDEVSSLHDVVGNLQVRLDSGTLVGEIINPIDSALAQKANFVGRGVNK